MGLREFLDSKTWMVVSKEFFFKISVSMSIEIDFILVSDGT